MLKTNMEYLLVASLSTYNKVMQLANMDIFPHLAYAICEDGKLNVSEALEMLNYQAADDETWIFNVYVLDENDDQHLESKVMMTGRHINYHMI